MAWPRPRDIQEVLFSEIESGMDSKSGQPPDLRDGIEELVRSIRKFGLLQPIVVCPLPGGKYRLIAGRRRVMACAMLQMTSAQAVILDSVPDPAIANAIWAAEHLVRHETLSTELELTFQLLLKKFGSANDIAEQTGIPVDKVRRYLPG